MHLKNLNEAMYTHKNRPIILITNTLRKLILVFIEDKY